MSGYFNLIDNKHLLENCSGLAVSENSSTSPSLIVGQHHQQATSPVRSQFSPSGLAVPYATLHQNYFKQTPISHVLRGKRSSTGAALMDDAQLLPSKRRATEEIISHRFSSMNISTANSSSYNQTNVPEEADMLSIVDVPIDDKSTPITELYLPPVLRHEYCQLTASGSLVDPTLQKILTPQTCLAVVPYTPRPTLPPLTAEDKAPKKINRRTKATKAKVIEMDDNSSSDLEEMDASPIESYPLSTAPLPTHFATLNGFQSQGRAFVFERSMDPNQPWNLRFCQ